MTFSDVLTLTLAPEDRHVAICRLLGLDVVLVDGDMVRLRRDGDQRFGVVVAAHTDGRVDVATHGQAGVDMLREVRDG